MSLDRELANTLGVLAARSWMKKQADGPLDQKPMTKIEAPMLKPKNTEPTLPLRAETGGQGFSPKEWDRGYGRTSTSPVRPTSVPASGRMWAGRSGGQPEGSMRPSGQGVYNQPVAGSGMRPSGPGAYNKIPSSPVTDNPSTGGSMRPSGVGAYGTSPYARPGYPSGVTNQFTRGKVTQQSSVAPTGEMKSWNVSQDPDGRAGYPKNYVNQSTSSYRPPQMESSGLMMSKPTQNEPYNTAITSELDTNPGERNMESAAGQLTWPGMNDPRKPDRYFHDDTSVLSGLGSFLGNVGTNISRPHSKSEPILPDMVGGPVTASGIYNKTNR